MAAETAEPATGPGRLSVPVLVPEMHLRRIPVQVRHLPVPVVGSAHLPQVPGAMRARLPEIPRNRLLWWGGLAGLAAFGVIVWPVAGVVAPGTYIATRGAKEAAHEEVAAEHEKAHREEPQPAT